MWADIPEVSHNNSQPKFSESESEFKLCQEHESYQKAKSLTLPLPLEKGFRPPEQV